MRRLNRMLCLLLALGLAWTAAPLGAEETERHTGKILALDRVEKAITLSVGPDATRAFRVDETKVPRWYSDHEVGEVVTVTVSVRPEEPKLVIAIRKASQT